MYMNSQLNSATVLKRIDTIIAELQALRQQVVANQTVETAEQPAPNLVEELAGSLGQGSAEEYDLLADWERFDS
jgi:hypothetical protein